MPYTADQALTLRGLALTDSGFRSRLLARPQETAAELLIHLTDQEAKTITDQAAELKALAKEIEDCFSKRGGLNALTKPGVGGGGSQGGGPRG